MPPSALPVRRRLAPLSLGCLSRAVAVRRDRPLVDGESRSERAQCASAEHVHEGAVPIELTGAARDP